MRYVVDGRSGGSKPNANLAARDQRRTATPMHSFSSYRHRNNVMVALTRLLGPIALQDDWYPNRARGGR